MEKKTSKNEIISKPKINHRKKKYSSFVFMNKKQLRNFRSLVHCSTKISNCGFLIFHFFFSKREKLFFCTFLIKEKNHKMKIRMTYKIKKRDEKNNQTIKKIDKKNEKKKSIFPLS